LEQFLIFLQKNPFHLLLFGTAVITGGMLLRPLFGRVLKTGKEVSVAEAVQLINRRDAVVVDVREPGEYAAGHVAGARNIPEAQLAGRMKELEKFKSRPVIVSCRTGARASAVAGTLFKSGFGEAFALRGGIAAWQQAGMPLEK
jgi:rhodanese-related sulfurtransferase